MIVVGMSIAYGVSLLGMALAAWRWHQNNQQPEDSSPAE